MIQILLFFSFLRACWCLPPGSGKLTVSTDKPYYSSDETIQVSFAPDASMPPPADDATYNVVVRKCNAVLTRTCEESLYTEWRQNPVTTVNKDQGAVSIMIDHTWPTGDYFISLESPTYGKTTTGQSGQNYIYGITSRLKITYTKGNIYIREPRDASTWQFDKAHTVTWSADGFNGGEVISVQVIDANMQTHDVGAVEQTMNGGSLSVTPNALWGTGGITIKAFLAENPNIEDTQTLNLAAPPAYFEILEPRTASAWGAGAPVTVQWQAHNVPSGTPLVITAYDEASGDTRPVAIQSDGLVSDAGQFQWTVPDISFTSSGWVITMNAGTIESKSEPFQITGSGSTGPCEIRKLKREMYLHDEMTCQQEPFMLIAGNVKIVKLVVEWLWCLDDRLRISAHILTDGGPRTVVTAKKINNEGIRFFEVLKASEHGNAFFILAKNIFREDQEGKKAITMDLEMFPYDAETDTAGPPGIPLKAGMRLETTDPECKCPYEDEGAPVCEEVRPPCVDPSDPMCDGPCVPGDVRAKCTEMKFPIPSQFQSGTDVCSAGLQVNVHSTPCQEGDQLLFTVKRKTTKMKVLSNEELPGCDKYWLNVQASQGTGWIISSLVSLCREPACVPGFNCPSDDASSLSLGFLVILTFIVALLV